MANPPLEKENVKEDRFGLLKTILRWGVPACLFLVSLGLGYIGFRQYAAQQGIPYNNLDLFYLSIQLFTLESGSVVPPIPWTLEIARWTAPVLPIFAAILGLFKLIRRFFRTELVRLYRNHVIISGAGLKGMTLARNLNAEGMKVVVLERDPNNLNIRLLERWGIPVFIGDATSPQNLRRARIDKARHLVALCREDQTNVSVAVAARALWKNHSKGAITCHIDVENREACRALVEKELHDSETPRCWLEFHKSDDIAAEQLLRDQVNIFQDRERNNPPHILFVGLDSMGRSLLLNAARMWSEMAESPEFKLEYTVIGQGADGALDSMLENHPPLQMWSRRENLLFSAHSLEDLKKIHRETDSPTGSEVWESHAFPKFDLAFVCAEADAETLSEALETHRFLRDASPQTPIFVPTYENVGFRRFLPGLDDNCSHYRTISVISILEKCFTARFLEKGTIEAMARRIHYYYLKDREEEEKANPPKNGNASSKKEWPDLSEDARMANYALARRIFDILSKKRFRIDPSREWVFEPSVFVDPLLEELAIAEHDSWCKERREQGWKTGRRSKSDNISDQILPWRKKRHDNLVSWQKLDPKTRDINKNMVKKWPVILQEIGFQIHPERSASCGQDSP